MSQLESFISREPLPNHDETPNTQQLTLYNFLTNRMELFEPGDPDDVKIYCCGPTVYAEAHLGHARVYIFADSLRRILQYHLGYGVRMVMNITDVCDRIIEHGGAVEFEKSFFETMKKLNIQKPHFTPKVTESMDIIHEFVHNGLKEHAYEKDGELRFHANSHSKDRVFPHFEARDQTIDTEGARDFVLWKSRQWVDEEGKPHESIPGWHSECAAIAAHYLGDAIDLHVGGSDLLFPHHENQITLGRLYFKRDRWVQFCLYSGILSVQGEKMSKSLANFKTVEAMISDGVSPLALRWHFLKKPYAKPMEFKEAAIQLSQMAYVKFMHHLTAIQQFLPEMEDRTFSASELDDFREMKKTLNASLLDNLNIPQALQAVEDYVHDLYVNKMRHMSRSGLRYCLDSVLWITDRYFGLHERETDEGNSNRLFEITKRFRNDVRTWTIHRMKRWGRKATEEKCLLKMCDDVRDELNGMNYVVEDPRKKPSVSEETVKSNDKLCRYPEISVDICYFNENAVITEKIDGSNFGFGYLEEDGELKFVTRSRNFFLREGNKSFTIDPIKVMIKKKADALKNELPFRQFMVYGEIFRPKVTSKGEVMYDKEKNKKSVDVFGSDSMFFAAFDLYNQDKEVFLKYDDYVKYFEKIDLPYIGRLSIREHYTYLFSLVETLKSNYSTSSLVEGLVVKENVEAKDRKMYKVVREEFNVVRGGNPLNKYKIKTYFNQPRIKSAASKVGWDVTLLKEEIVRDCMKDFTCILKNDLIYLMDDYFDEEKEKKTQKKNWRLHKYSIQTYFNESVINSVASRVGWNENVLKDEVIKECLKTFSAVFENDLREKVDNYFEKN